MLSLVRRSFTPAVMLGWLLVGGPATAAVPEIKDDAHFFKAETLAKASEGETEIQGDGFCMPDVQVAVGLGRKARDHLRVTALLQVSVDDLGDEVRADVPPFG